MSAIRDGTSAAAQVCGGALSAGAQTRQNPADSPAFDSPARNVKDADSVASSTVSATGLLTANWLGPPNDRAPVSVIRSRGRTSPYSGRGHSAVTISTLPDNASTDRSSSCGAPAPNSWPRCPAANASASRSRTLPVGVVNVVSSTSVPGR